MKTSTVFPPVFEDKLTGTGIPESEQETIGRELSDARGAELAESPIQGTFDIEYFAKIHRHLFQDVSNYAGVIRGYGMNKGSQFADPSQMPYLFDKELPERINSLNQYASDKEKNIDGMSDLHSTLDLAHPFREGNGRATRVFMSQLAETHGYQLDFSGIDPKQWVEACIHSINTGQETLKRPLFERVVMPAKRYQQP